jgi:hypothetical protein
MPRLGKPIFAVMIVRQKVGFSRQAKFGRMEEWKDGRMEEWKDGKTVAGC